MVKRTVVWTETAVKQRRAILKFWTKQNCFTRFAEKLIHVISNQIKIILSHPESFKSMNYPETRESAMGHFSVFYKLTNDHLIVTAFWDNRQNPKKLLEIIRK